MACYKVNFSPMGPYFFGNEKNFKFPGQKKGQEYCNNYFIRSEDTPSQTTVLGALRYLLLPNINNEFTYSDEEKEENNKAVGEVGFKAESPNIQSFGRIQMISPLFLEDGSGHHFISCPLDHICGQSKYSPFLDYEEVKTSEGKKLFAKDYDIKNNGLEGGYLCIETGNIIKKKDVFRPTIRVGINRSKPEDGFFKKEYKILVNRYSFSVYAIINSPSEEEMSTQRIITMGQGKAPFVVSMEVVDDDAIENLKEKISTIICSKIPDGYSKIYCFGDAFSNANPCNETVFAVYDTRDFRSFVRSNQSAWVVQKGSLLHRMIKSGSVFLVENPTDWLKKHSHPNGEQIGFNQFIVVGGE